ncbi:MAG: flagellar basal-body MS-ring/collar protein FliF [Anaerobiospirillum succiniciproducens]|uniref:flagellar basal-body MS-ring/collar protein FliF n=1 Tax=Anaerobiospirillum succiniciproducens TaxID=13335 RepID=UPI002355EFDE|nr:flagellar basal-body MS-ring/collar protein FliF [Anaerobiospirillum succiniciproducens]MCI6863536.1 flagellar M-ring protein FliF [Anaerobiospirillum succiniciproducens]MDY2798542.1 flagellar basal-body MS-ring/collar protein FliF [Anaerobiospirillum succiniciproducens]
MSDNSFPVAANGNQQGQNSTALVDTNAYDAGQAQNTDQVSADAVQDRQDGDDSENRIGGTVGNTVNTEPQPTDFKNRVGEFLRNGEILRKLIILGFLVLFLTGAVFGLLSLQANNSAASQRSIGRYTPEELGKVIDFLSLQGFNYTLNGDSVLVHVDDYAMVREAMLRNGVAINKIAEQDALIMKDNGFGVSQRLESERIKHSRELQLANAITRINGVEHATVLLAIPRDNVFARSQQRPSAAVVVTLQQGAYLSPDNVNSIRFTVSSSVHNMLAKDVTVTDQHGRLLSDNTGANAKGEDRLQKEFEMRTLREAQYRDKLDTILRPMLGEGNYSAEVDVTLDTTIEEETRQFFNPDNQAVRSETLREEIGGKEEGTPFGVPGSLSNQPPANATIPQQLRDGTAMESDSAKDKNENREAVRNYEVDTTVRHTIRPTNSVQRLTVSVAVDYLRQTGADGAVNYVPRTQEELDKIAALVRGGLGLNETRGDFVNVATIEFPHNDVTPALPWWQQEAFLRILRIAGAVLIILVLVVFVVRPMVNRLLRGKSAADIELEQQLELDNGSALGGEDDLNLIAAQNELADQIYNINREGGIELPNLHRDEDLLNAVRTLVSNEPQLSAEVLRDWINSDSADKKDKKKGNKAAAASGL